MGTDNIAANGKQIYSLLIQIMNDLGAIKKERKNSGKGYRFRGIEDVLNRLHPVLIKHNVSISQQTSNHSHETIEDSPVSGSPSKVKRIYRSFLEMTVTFYAPDGSSVSNTAVGEGMDYNDDKATSKAMSAAFKYAVFLGLCVPIDEGELPDSDTRSPKDSGPPTSGSGEVVITSPQNNEPSVAMPANGPANPAVNGTQQGKHSYSESEPCNQYQRETIIALVTRIGEAMNIKHEEQIAWLKGIIAKKGKAKLADLTYGEANTLIPALEAKLTEEEAKMMLDTSAE